MLVRRGGQFYSQSTMHLDNCKIQRRNTKKYKVIQKEITEGIIYSKFVLVFAFLFNFHAGGAVNNCEKKSWLFIISCICISAPSSFAHFSISTGCSYPHLEVLLKPKEVSVYPSWTIKLNLSSFDHPLKIRFVVYMSKSGFGRLTINAQQCVFIGPRYTWGPIFRSRPLSLRNSRHIVRT